MSDKDYQFREGQLVQSTITYGWSHQEFVVGDTPTKFPTLPKGTKAILWQNDSGVNIRYGGSDVEWEVTGATTKPKRGVNMVSGETMSVGVVEAGELYAVADAAGRKTVLLFAI